MVLAFIKDVFQYLFGKAILFLKWGKIKGEYIWFRPWDTNK